jgi:hypothetical protein
MAIQNNILYAECPACVNAIRRRTDFGDATGVGKMGGECFGLSAGVDTAPLFQGREAG